MKTTDQSNQIKMVTDSNSSTRTRSRNNEDTELQDEFDRNVRARANDINWQVVVQTADHKIPRGYTAMTAVEMMEEHAISKRKVMFLRLLRVKTQHKKGNGFSISTARKSTTRTELGSHRLFLCMDVMINNGQTV